MTSPFQEIFDKLQATQERLLKNLPDYQRVGTQADWLKGRGLLILGPRGVGKTTFLLQQALKIGDRAFYCSLDNPLLGGASIYKMGEELYQQNYRYLFFDEVHYGKDWSQHLKALYDSFPDLHMIASDSSSLVLRTGLGDLSRRYLTKHISYLSFREYLLLKSGVSLETLPWKDFHSEKKRKEHFDSLTKAFNKKDIQPIKEFKNYLNEGSRPFFLEGDFAERAKNILEKIIYADIPSFLPEVRDRHLQLMRQVVSHLALSPIPTVNIESLAKDWAVTKSTVYNLLSCMHESSLIRIIPHEGAKKKSFSKGAKIFFSDPCLYYSLQGQLGNSREAFFCMQADLLNLQAACPKEDSQYDYSIEDVSFEIGGAGKKNKAADFCMRDGFSEMTKTALPLWYWGFLA